MREPWHLQQVSRLTDNRSRRTVEIIFTVAMFLDIWSFGIGMSKDPGMSRVAFTPLGRFILLVIVSLLITGWLLIALRGTNSAGMPLILFIVFVVLLPFVGELARRVAGHK